uniref:FecR family protein n=1 Tax=Pedobacter schmidteae TaxID=2201271 RepID=UPI000EAE92DC|nr:FecR family protein [Pedobacter schmidteae]
MNKEKLSYLRLQYLSGNITDGELAELKLLVSNPDLDAAFIELAEEIWLAGSQDVEPLNVETAREIYVQVTASVQQKKTVKLWPRFAVAASVILIAGVGLYFLLNRPDAVYHSDAAPGTVGATLTLASGKQIRLGAAAKGTLANEAGVTITKQADGKLVYQIGTAGKDNSMNTLSTTRGETYQVRLSDGTMVWLNADSRLTYAAALNESGTSRKNDRLGARRVKLEGEAYFEVAKVYKPSAAEKGTLSGVTERVPFIVETPTQQIEVLGTHFNINSYSDEPLVSTTLMEGSVRVAAAGHSKGAVQAVVLSPGQQAINQQGDIKVVKANLEQVTDWKQGDFYLNHINFKTAMRKIARWYNVEVVYDASVSDEIEAGGWISRNKKLSEVLQSIEATGQVHFKIEGRKIIVFK